MVDDEPSVVRTLDLVHERLGEVHRELLALVAEVDRTSAWEDSGARDTAHCCRSGSASRPGRPTGGSWRHTRSRRCACRARSRERLGIDKVLELSRFATPETGANLIVWASRVSCAAVRRRADAAVRALRSEIVEAERARTLSWWWYDDGRRFGLEAHLPADQGAIVASTLERVAE